MNNTQNIASQILLRAELAINMVNYFAIGADICSIRAANITLYRQLVH